MNVLLIEIKIHLCQIIIHLNQDKNIYACLLPIDQRPKSFSHEFTSSFILSNTILSICVQILEIV